VAKPPCFLSGVRIRAARGDVAVETIAVGQDVVVIRDGREVLEPVQWVGYSNIDLSRHAHPEDAAPIRIRKNAIAENQPSSDLFVSPEHCLVLDGRCVPAKLLVNGGSITSERDHAPFTYHHIELQRHGVLLADNTPSESYLDTGNRFNFDNAGVPRQLHPSFEGNFTDQRWATDACAPLAKVPEEVDPIWSRLAARSEAIGYPIPAVNTQVDSDIHVVADGRAIRPTCDGDVQYVFAIPAGVSSVSLMSKFCIPSDKMVPSVRDTRRLGVSVKWMSISTDSGETIIPADHPALITGWNDAEQDGSAIARWTDGAAIVPWDGVSGSATLTVCCSPVDQYPVYDDKLRLVA
jgi:hypothetical protein